MPSSIDVRVSVDEGTMDPGEYTFQVAIIKSHVGSKGYLGECVFEREREGERGGGERGRESVCDRVREREGGRESVCACVRNKDKVKERVHNTP